MTYIIWYSGLEAKWVRIVLLMGLFFFSLRGEMDFSNEMEIFYEMEPQNVHIKSKYAIASFFFFFFVVFFFLSLIIKEQIREMTYLVFWMTCDVEYFYNDMELFTKWSHKTFIYIKRRVFFASSFFH